MNRLFVRFAGDNDFYRTVRAFVEAIAPRVLLGEWVVTKDDVARLFNETSYALYLLHQSHKHQVENAESIKNYLQIEPKDVYFDEEIDNFTNFNSDGCLATLEHDHIGYYIM